MSDEQGEADISVSSLPELRRFFADHGWALALHGSCKRDLDFIAVPWAMKYPTEVGALVRVIEGEFARLASGPTWKPHGRLSYAFMVREWDGVRPRDWDISFVDGRNAIDRAFPVLP